MSKNQNNGTVIDFYASFAVDWNTLYRKRNALQCLRFQCENRMASKPSRSDNRERVIWIFDKKFHVDTLRQLCVPLHRILR